MKMRRCWLLGLSQLTAILLFSLVRVSAEVTFSAGIEIHSAADFYDPLGSYGEWVDVRSYGRCWHPTYITETDWRPYADGHWEWTDCGWYWVSDEPWAWACYHYGYWTFDPAYGWIWVPGTEWAPAWVVWRESPEYIGWAPCGPSGVVVAPSLFCFVDIHHFHGRIYPRSLIVNNTTIVQRTRVINGIRHESRTFDGGRQRVVVNNGPDVKIVQRATGSTFSARPVREIVREEPLPQRIIQERAAPWRRERAKVIQEQPRTHGSPEQPRTSTGERQTREGTGRDQPRSYEQPSQPRAPQQQPSVTEPRRTTPPTGRDQPRIYQQPTQPQAPSPSEPRRTQPPTGGEQPRVYPQQPSTAPVKPTPPERQSREQVRPTPPERPSREQVAPERPNVPTAPPERALPPGQERKLETPAAPRIERERPVEREVPARPPERAAQPDRGREPDRGKDKDRP